jgi:hypothetical protein
VPSDIVERGPDTVVCDLNASRLPDLRHLGVQVAAFSGVLEYVADVGAVARWLPGLGVHTCIASYDPWPPGLSLVGSFRESARRLQNGYMSALTEESLLRCFADAGMRCVDARRWTRQGVYAFVMEARSDPVASADAGRESH